MAVIMDFTQTPSVLPECYPMDVAILRHCFERDIKVFTMSSLPQGAAVIQTALTEVSENYPDIKSDVDYCNFGYRPWALKVPIILGMGDDITKTLETNSAGRKLENLPIMDGIKNYGNIQLVIEISGSAKGYAWMTYARATYGQDVAVGVTAVMAADVYPFLQTGQLIGSLGGLKGAAEYEQLIDAFAKNGIDYSKKKAHDPKWIEKQYSLSDVAYKFKKARIGMDAQAIVHVLMIIFIIIGNIGYFLEKKEKKI